MKHSILLFMLLLQLTLAALIMPESGMPEDSDALLDDAAAVMDARLFTTADERPEEQNTLNDDDDNEVEEEEEEDEDGVDVDDDAEDDIFPDFKNDEGQALLFDAPPPHLFKEEEQDEDDDALWLEEDLDIDLAPYQWQWRGFLVVSVLILAYQAWRKGKRTQEAVDEVSPFCVRTGLVFFPYTDGFPIFPLSRV